MFDLTLYLKKHVISNLSYCLDVTAFDNNNSNLNRLGYSQNNLIYITSFYLYQTRIRLHLTTVIDKSSNLRSIDYIYKNANWMEREAIEMFGISIFNKSDGRRLLLNYFDSYNPLKKNFKSSSNYEVYYDFIDRQVNYVSGVRSEL